MCANRRERDTDRCRARNARGNETKTRERNTKRSGVLPEVFPKRDEASEDESDDRGRESHGQTLGGGNALERRVFGTPDASSSEGEEEEEEDKSKTDKEEASEERKQQGGPTKAQKRREKKAAEEKARELAIEMERARLRESDRPRKKSKRKRCGER